MVFKFFQHCPNILKCPPIFSTENVAFFGLDLKSLREIPMQNYQFVTGDNENKEIYSKI